MDGGSSNVKKSITIDSASLSGNGSLKNKRTKNKTARRIRPSSIVQPSVLKKTLLERIKQHQRTREHTREKDNKQDILNTDTNNNTGNNNNSNNNNETKIGGETFTTEFSKSLDFLQKLSLKRQQVNKTRRNNNSHNAPLTSSAITNASNVKTPEAKMLNQVAETLTNGEIITNTGIIGLPVNNVYRESIAIMNNNNGQNNNNGYNNNGYNNNGYNNSTNNNTFIPPISIQPSISNIAAPAEMFSQQNTFPSGLPSQINTNITPSITDLATIYNNTIASVSSDSLNAAGDNNNNQLSSSNSLDQADQSIHVPEDPVSFLPSIFIKEEPPHGCLKQGKKPTFREWANKILKKPVDTIKDIFNGGGGSSDNVNNGLDNNNLESNTLNKNDLQNSQTSQPNNLIGGGGGGGSGGTDNNNENITGMRLKIRKTLKKKYRVGKHDDVVGVLLKNKESQRHIQKQHLTLKNKSIGEIRKHLYDKNLLKIGSNAPPDVVRRLYEDSILTGDVKNTGGDVLVHNFFSNE
jgi:hypothetical protein